MPVQELENEKNKRQEELFKLSFSRTETRIKNPLRIRILRREIAAIATWMNGKARVVTAAGQA